MAARIASEEGRKPGECRLNKLSMQGLAGGMVSICIYIYTMYVYEHMTLAANASCKPKLTTPLAAPAELIKC